MAQKFFAPSKSKFWKTGAFDFFVLEHDPKNKNKCCKLNEEIEK